jgi:hypothetical protein
MNAEKTGEYAQYLLTTSKDAKPDEVACHYIALMYRSVDERLSKKERLHAVHCVRVASKLLKDVLGRMERKESVDGLVVDFGERKRKRRVERGDEEANKKSRRDDGSGTAHGLNKEKSCTEREKQTDIYKNPTAQNKSTTTSTIDQTTTADASKQQSSDTAKTTDYNSASDMSVSAESSIEKSTASASTLRVANQNHDVSTIDVATTSTSIDEQNGEERSGFDAAAQGQDQPAALNTHDRPSVPGIPLATDTDNENLPAYMCYIRSNCIEYFSTTLSEGGSPQRGRRTEVFEGRVGVRCVFCKHLPVEERATQSDAFPNGLDKIHSAVVVSLLFIFCGTIHLFPALKLH